MKLRPTLVPKPLWGISAYRLLGRGAKWKAIRQDALAASSHRCSICRIDAVGLTCHEEWHYNDKVGTATLAAFVIHCPDCDVATHMGRASRHGAEQVAIEQLCRVNDCTPEQAHKLFADAMAVWRARNDQGWTTLVEASLLARYPALSMLHERRADLCDS